MKPRIYILAFALMTAVSSAFAVDVTLNFFVGHTKIHTETVSSGNKYTLSSFVSGDTIATCRDYTFFGWKEGSAVDGDFVSSDTVLTVIPSANVNLFAVFQKATVNRYMRITTLDNLEAGGKYLIVCHYVYGGDQQYYAMSNQSGTYTYQGYNYYKLGAERIFPRNSVITEPGNSLVWTLQGTAGNWKWIPLNEPTKSLYVGNNSYPLLDTYDNRCHISVANGVFTISNTSDNRFLKYVDDNITETEDYFITGTTVSADNYRINVITRINAFKH